MSVLVPAGAAPGSSVLNALSDPAGGTLADLLKAFSGQSAIRKTIPWFIGVVALGGMAFTWSMLSSGVQRTLYAQLDDSERASVVAALEKAAISYKIDSQTGALTVGESDLYKARMTVAQDGALATPDSGDDMLGNLPIGASRTLEGERLRSAKERELMMTISEIDGVESVRVHLAQGEKSAFIRESSPPSASVMLKLARGRQLSDNQVTAITNLVGSSIPGLSVDQVKVIDQHGRLLTAHAGSDSDRLELQARMEEKLRNQLAGLLTPMIGEGNFSAQIQVELDMDQTTSARESYEKQGVLRSETQQQSQSTGTSGGSASGVPGVLSNTPPPATTAQPGAPGQATVQQAAPASAAAAAPQPQSNGESSATRNYELGREVAVANTTPGKLKRLSVAVALSAEAMKGGKAADADQIKQLVSAAVGADAARGDQVAVMVRKFDKVSEEGVPFYETSWFADILRYSVGLIGVLLVLMLGVRPLIKAFRPGGSAKNADEGDFGEVSSHSGIDRTAATTDPESLKRQVSLAQRMIDEQPESAVIALRKMLQANGMESAR